ncbi:MAG: hybrid sensor histidine kinase/response regulator [Myxococcales bacterium]
MPSASGAPLRGRSGEGPPVRPLDTAELLRAVERSSASGLTAVDLTGRLIYVNRSFCDLVGWSADELVGALPPFRYWAGDRVAAYGEALQDLVNDRVALSAGLERTFQKRSGEQFSVHLSLAPLLDDNGVRIGVIGAVTDTSQVLRLELEALRLRQAIDASGEAVFMTGSDGTFTFVNAEFTRLYGYAAEDVVGKATPRILKSNLVSAERYAELWKALLGKHKVRWEITNQTKDGSPVHIDGSINPVLDARGEITGFLAIQRDVTQRKRAEEQLRRSDEALRASEKQYHDLFDNNPVPTWVSDVESQRFLAVNDTAVRHYGYSREEFLQMTFMDLHLPGDRGRLDAFSRSTPVGVAGYGLWKHVKKDGAVIDVEITGQQFELGSRRVKIVYANDVSETRRLEQQFLQAQKMEAVGRLAGGVAHDFNNLLSVILTYSEMAIRGMAPANPLRADLEEIRKAGVRATALTRQLLAFSRQQVLVPQILSLNELIDGFGKMIGRLIGDDVELAVRPCPDLGSVRADPGQIEQVLMNLAVNARDAMPKGGKLTLETANVELGEDYAREHLGVEPGPYVLLAVSDTGTGMDKATQARIFEPFFTTKEKGKGTGLGLSTVFGIVKQSKGHVSVYSEPGKGTTFKVYFPRSDGAATPIAPQAEKATLLTGTETILLVEDDEQSRRVLLSLLQSLGYRVLVAKNGREAQRISEEQAAGIDLLLTDVVMPELGGPELIERLSPGRPGMKVLCMSGYADQAVMNGILAAGLPFIQKPLTLDNLAHKVREVLGARR